MFQMPLIYVLVALDLVIKECILKLEKTEFLTSKRQSVSPVGYFYEGFNKYTNCSFTISLQSI